MSGKKLSKNIIIYGLSNGLKSLVPFIMLPILTTYISAEGVGLLSLIETSILFIAPFILLNIEAGISVEYFKLEKKHLTQYVSNGFLLSVSSFVVIQLLFYFAHSFISQTLGLPQKFVLLLPVFVILRLIPTVLLVLFQAKQKSFNYLFFSLFQTVFDFALSGLFIILWKQGYLGRLQGTYIAFFISSIIGFWFIYKMGYLKWEYSKTSIQKIIKFGIPLIPHAIGGTIIAMSDRYFISIFQNNSEVGLYTVSYQIAALMLLFSLSVNQAWSPILFDLLNKKEFKSIEKFTGLLFFSFVFIGFVVYLTYDFIFQLLIDPSFYEAKKYVPLLLLGFIFQSIYFLFANFIFYSKKTQVLALITFSGAILNLILNYILIKDYGVIGVAYSTAITWFLFMLVTIIIVKLKFYKVDRLS
jgi:O-antigen/teichoic acid export membrane protein